MTREQDFLNSVLFDDFEETVFVHRQNVIDHGQIAAVDLDELGHVLPTETRRYVKAEIANPVYESHGSAPCQYEFGAHHHSNEGRICRLEGPVVVVEDCFWRFFQPDIRKIVSLVQVDEFGNIRLEGVCVPRDRSAHLHVEGFDAIGLVGRRKMCAIGHRRF